MYQYRCLIKRVVDGDTVDVDIDLGFGVWLHGERVRLYGIDTPESRTRDKVEKKFGLLSKDFLKSLLVEGEHSTLVTLKYDSKGKFGRILGSFKVDDELVTDIMIREGHAVPYHGQSKDDLEQLHLANRKRLIAEDKIDLQS